MLEIIKLFLLQQNSDRSI